MCSCAVGCGNDAGRPAIVESKTNEGDLARCYLRYMDALKHPEKIDDVATPDARFRDLEAMGYPKGPEEIEGLSPVVEYAGTGRTWPDHRHALPGQRHH